MLLVGILVSLLVSAIAAFVVFRTQQRSLAQMQAQQQAWERAQEVHHQQWTVQLERRSLDLEKNLTLQVQQLQAEWRSKETNYITRIENLQNQFEAATMQIRIEHELTRLPRVEDTPLPTRGQDHNTRPKPHRQPPHLEGADLSQRDLSSRYLAHANLRNATVVSSNLFMADLSWADLSKADMSGANLSAANLTHADLSNANLEGADFLVTDLYSTNLTGANLRHASNLTAEQLHTAIHDKTTRLDPAIEETLARLQGQPVPSASRAPGSMEDTGRFKAVPEPIVEQHTTEEQEPSSADRVLSPQQPEEDTISVLAEQLSGESVTDPESEQEKATMVDLLSDENTVYTKDDESQPAEEEHKIQVKKEPDLPAAKSSERDSTDEKEVTRSENTSENAHAL